MKIGLIQTRGIGDIIIALPIADYFRKQGHEVFWPIDARYVDMFRSVAPMVNFIAVTPGNDLAYYVQTPDEMLRRQGCNHIYCLYHQLGTLKVANPGLAACLKFDEYKYGVTGVPFREKWNLQLRRDRMREKQLFDSLNLTKPYICIHSIGSDDISAEFALPAPWQRDYMIVRIAERTTSVFDWTYALEKASKLILVDSCIANLVEQLNLPNEKYFLLRSPGAGTPVMKNGWKIISPQHQFLMPEQQQNTRAD